MPHTVSHSATPGQVSGHDAVSPLEQARRAAGLSRDRLAIVAGVNPRTVYRLEVNRTPPSRLTASALAAALEVKPEDLFPVDLQVRPVNPRLALWPPPDDTLNRTVQAYRAAGDALGAAELLADGTHEATVRNRLNQAGCKPRPRGGSRADGVKSLAAWARNDQGVSIQEAVEAAQQGRVPGAFLEDLDDPVIGVRWAVRP